MNVPVPVNTNSHQTVKCALENVLVHPLIFLALINTMVELAHKLRQVVCLFAMNYLIHRYTNPLPDITPLLTLDSYFFKIIIRTVTNQHYEPKLEKHVTLYNDMLQFFKLRFLPDLPIGQAAELQQCQSFYRSTSEYMAVQISTDYLNNLQANFIKYVIALVNNHVEKELVFDSITKSETMNADQKKLARKKWYTCINAMVQDLLNPSRDTTCPPEYENWICFMRGIIIPELHSQGAMQNGILYDLKTSPQLYHKSSYKILSYFTSAEKTSYNLFPQTTSNIPGFIRIDTSTLMYHFGEKYLQEILGGNKIVDDLDEKKKAAIWEKIFKIKMKHFHYHPRAAPVKNRKMPVYRHQFKFDFQVLTDGVACNLLLVNKEKKYVKTSTHGVRHNNMEDPIKEKYVDELSAEERLFFDLTLWNKITVDPGIRDRVYMINSATRGQHQIEWRSTQQQYQKETKQKKYEKFRKQIVDGWPAIDGLKVKQWEERLSNYNHKWLDPDLVREYTRQKLLFNFKVAPCYQERRFRYFRFAAYMRKQIVDKRMLKSFARTFQCDPSNTLLLWGDHSPRYTAKFQPPTVKGKAMRKLFLAAGYKVRISFISILFYCILLFVHFLFFLIVISLYNLILTLYMNLLPMHQSYFIQIRSSW